MAEALPTCTCAEDPWGRCDRHDAAEPAPLVPLDAEDDRW